MYYLNKWTSYKNSFHDLVMVCMQKQAMVWPLMTNPQIPTLPTFLLGFFKQIIPVSLYIQTNQSLICSKQSRPGLYISTKKEDIGAPKYNQKGKHKSQGSVTNGQAILKVPGRSVTASI